jgi:hypothetical protein
MKAWNEAKRKKVKFPSALVQTVLYWIFIYVLLKISIFGVKNNFFQKKRLSLEKLLAYA